ncbi:hypothetical protein [Pseudomonas taetrolens]|uniref:hypothetical protein n=1 Tax=Pseudomonas taetrolens TaxID=47884 RepID=UPI003F9A138F
MPHHDEIGFRHVLKALIHVELLREKTLATQEQCSQYYARQNEAAPYSVVTEQDDMTLKKQAKPTEALLTFEVFYNGELFQTVEFSSLRKCNNWREKNLETPFLYVIKTPDCNRESCIELSKRYFLTKHRVYPDLFERPEWDVVTEAECNSLQRLALCGKPASAQVYRFLSKLAAVNTTSPSFTLTSQCVTALRSSRAT